MDESIRDNDGPPRRIEGLTQFLQEEYYKRVGIYSEDGTKLFEFWKSHVSKHYREERERKMKEKDQKQHANTVAQADMLGLESFMMDLEFNIEGTKSATKPPLKGTPKPKTLKGGLSTTKKGQTLTSQPPKPYAFKMNYEKYESLPEYDVRDTINKDLEEQENKRNQQLLRKAERTRLKQEAEAKDKHVAQVKKVADVYFEDIALRNLRGILYQKFELNDSQIREEEFEAYNKADKAPVEAVKPRRPSSAAPKPSPTKDSAKDLDLE